MQLRVRRFCEDFVLASLLWTAKSFVLSAVSDELVARIFLNY